MSTLFMLAAIVGGVLLTCQFVMTLLGLGGHDLDGSHDLAGDMGHADGHDIVHDAAETHSAGQGGAHGAMGAGQAATHGSSWLFGLLSLRTVTAGLTFFGLAGLTAESAGWSSIGQISVAIAAGGISLWTVRTVLRQFRRLNEDGTIRIQRAIGKIGTVYIPIPAGKNGSGKVQLDVMGRLMEYEAVTEGAAKLPTGAKVSVTGVIGTSTLEVRAVETP